MRYHERRKIALRAASPKANRLDQLIDGRDSGGRSFIYRLVGEFLGLKSPEHGRPRWPKDMADIIKFDGWSFVLTTQEKPHQGHPSGHRLYVVCPDCNGIIPVGRFHQHVGSKKCQKGRAAAIAAAARPMNNEEATVYGDSVHK